MDKLKNILAENDKILFKFDNSYIVYEDYIAKLKQLATNDSLSKLIEAAELMQQHNRRDALSNILKNIRKL